MEVDTARKSSHLIVLNDQDKDFKRSRHVRLSTSLVEQDKVDSKALAAARLRMNTAKGGQPKPSLNDILAQEEKVVFQDFRTIQYWYSNVINFKSQNKIFKILFQ